MVVCHARSGGFLCSLPTTAMILTGWRKQQIKVDLLDMGNVAINQNYDMIQESRQDVEQNMQ